MCVMFVASTMSWQKMPNMKRKRHSHGSIYNKGILYVMCGEVSGKVSAFIDCPGFSVSKCTAGEMLITAGDQNELY